MELCSPSFSVSSKRSLSHSACPLISQVPSRRSIRRSLSSNSASTIGLRTTEKPQTSVNLKLVSTIDQEILPLVKEGKFEDVLAKLRASNPTSKVYSRVLRLYIDLGLLEESRKVYLAMKAEGFSPGVVTETCLLNLWLNSGWLDCSQQLFDEMSHRNVVAWTSMIVGFVKNDQPEMAFTMFCWMLVGGIRPNDFTFNAAIQACTSVDHGKQVHSLTVKTGFSSHSRVENCLIGLYARFNMISDAQLVFGKMLEPDIVSYTTLISGLSHSGLCESAINVFERMLSLRLEPNEHTIGSVLNACGDLLACELGMQVHAYAIKADLFGIFCASSLINMYSKCSEIDYARIVFDAMQLSNVVTWSGMIDGYVKNGLVKEALELFVQMLVMGIKPNEFTLATVISSCGLSSSDIINGLQLQCYAIKLNFESNDRVMNALITMYARKNMVDELGQVFVRIPVCDPVSWSATISGYAQNGQNVEAARMLCLMHREDAKPTKHAFASVISSSGDLAALEQGKQFHALSLKLSFDNDICVSNALISMYSKCGSMADACMAFEVTPTPDVMSWNTLIHAYAHHGMGKEALEVFERMTSVGEVPDDATMVGILSACSHAGYVNKACKYFNIMDCTYRITPMISHYSCMVDILGRAGKLDEAAELIDKMPFEPDSLVWKTLLAACRLHKDVRLGKIAAARAISLSPSDSANYILLANLLEENGELDGAERARSVMEVTCAKKDAGYSWIEIRNEVHAFSSRDKSHPRTRDIYVKLEELIIEMKEAGYVPDLKFAP